MSVLFTCWGVIDHWLASIFTRLTCFSHEGNLSWALHRSQLMDSRPELEESLTSFFQSSGSPWRFHTTKTASFWCHLIGTLDLQFNCYIKHSNKSFEITYLSHHIMHILVAWLQKVIPQIHLQDHNNKSHYKQNIDFTLLFIFMKS